MSEAGEERGHRAAGVAGFVRNLFHGVPLATYLLLLVLFVCLEWLLIKVTLLPASSYFQPILSWEVFKNLPSLTWRLLPLALVLGLMGWRWRTVGAGWGQWEGGALVRPLSIVSAFVLAWPFATYDFNLYFGQTHLADRLLVVAFFAGICWRPVFLWPFLVVVVTIGWQIYWPFKQGLHWAAPDMPIRVLILVGAWQLYTLVTRSRSIRPLLFLVACVIALHYWPSGWAKLRINWALYNHVPYLLSSSWASGWWAGVSGETIGAVVKSLSPLNLPMKLFTIVAECGVLFFFWRRGFSRLLVVMWMALHIGVWLLSGICFWQWVAVEACFLLLLFRARPYREGEFHNLGHLVAAAVIIFTSKWWLSTAALTWFDSPANYSYRFEATGESGKTYLLPPRFFSPYEEAFTFGTFSFLSEEPVLPVTGGATHRRIFDRLHPDPTEEKVLTTERELGTVRFDPARRDLMVEFLRRSLQDVHQQRSHRERLRWLAPPRRIWSLREEREYRYEEPLVSVQVVQVLSLFDGEAVRKIRRQPVLTVDLRKPVP